MPLIRARHGQIRFKINPWWWTAPIQKKRSINVASVSKEVSEWLPDVGRTHQLRAGIELTRYVLMLTLSVRNGVLS